MTVEGPWGELHPRVTVHESDNDIHLLTRHLSGTSTPEEEERLRAWLAADPARQRLLDNLYAA